MRRAFACVIVLFLILGMSSGVHALGVDVDEIIYQTDAGVPDLGDFLSVDINFTSPDANTLVITLTNTTSGFSFGDLNNSPSSIALTGLGFQTLGFRINGGMVEGEGTDTGGNPVDWTFYWGYDNNPLASGPFLNLSTLVVDSVVSTLTAAVDTPFDSSAGNGDIDGPKHGILPESYSGNKMPYLLGSATITLNLTDGGIANLEEYVAFLNSEGNVVASFGSPNAVPEPATMLLLGTGLVGLGAFRRKFRK